MHYIQMYLKTILKFVLEYGDVSRMGSDVFFHGLAEGETCEVEVAEGKTLYSSINRNW